jgi:hypothetical protein
MGLGKAVQGGVPRAARAIRGRPDTGVGHAPQPSTNRADTPSDVVAPCRSVPCATPGPPAPALSRPRANRRTSWVGRRRDSRHAWARVREYRHDVAW